MEIIAGGKGTLFADENKTDALCWNLYQIADATGKISTPVKDWHPEVPWREVANFRNFMAHAYEGIDRDRMWEEIQRGDITDLSRKLAAIATEIVAAPPVAPKPPRSQ